MLRFIQTIKAQKSIICGKSHVIRQCRAFCVIKLTKRGDVKLTKNSAKI